MRVEFADDLLNLCLSVLSPIAAAKCLLNKKADVKVRRPPALSPPDLGLCLCCCFPPSFTFQCQRSCSWRVSPHLIVTTLFSVLTIRFLSRCIHVSVSSPNGVSSIWNRDLLPFTSLFLPEYRAQPLSDTQFPVCCTDASLHYTWTPAVSKGSGLEIGSVQGYVSLRTKNTKAEVGFRWEQSAACDPIVLHWSRVLCNSHLYELAWLISISFFVCLAALQFFLRHPLTGGF